MLLTASERCRGALDEFKSAVIKNTRSQVAFAIGDPAIDAGYVGHSCRSLPLPVVHWAFAGLNARPCLS